MLPIVTGVLAAHIEVDCLLQLQKVGICYMAFLRRGFCFYLDHAPRSCAMEYFSFASPDIPILRLGVVFRIVRNNRPLDGGEKNATIVVRPLMY